MRPAIWGLLLSSVVVIGTARGEEKPEATSAPEAQTASQSEPAPEATPTEAAPTDSATPTTDAKTEEAPVRVEPETAPASPSAPVEPAQAQTPEPEKAPAPKAIARGPFQGSWQEASADEKALFLEAFGESSKTIQERWDKATPEERHKILRGHPLLSARAMKHRWSAATPEERAAFLEATGKVAQKIKEAWENATPEQRKLLALEHPYFARKALHHAWTQATPQEKIAFLVAHPALYGELKSRWSSANATQKQWYVKNYPGVESLAAAKPWAETSTEERSAFLDANAAIADKAREAWQKMQPEMRATLVRKWQGWPLKAYQARLDSAGKTLVSVKTRPAATSTKRTDKPSSKR